MCFCSVPCSHTAQGYYLSTKALLWLLSDWSFFLFLGFRLNNTWCLLCVLCNFNSSFCLIPLNEMLQKRGFAHQQGFEIQHVFFPQDDQGGRATERVATVGLQTGDSAQTPPPSSDTWTQRNQSLNTILDHRGTESSHNNLMYWGAVPEDPGGRVLEQSRCQDVCERRHRSCTVRAPAGGERNRRWTRSRTSSYMLTGSYQTKPIQSRTFHFQSFSLCPRDPCLEGT